MKWWRESGSPDAQWKSGPWSACCRGRPEDPPIAADTETWVRPACPLSPSYDGRRAHTSALWLTHLFSSSQRADTRRSGHRSGQTKRRFFCWTNLGGGLTASGLCGCVDVVLRMAVSPRVFLLSRACLTNTHPVHGSVFDLCTHTKRPCGFRASRFVWRPLLLECPVTRIN